LPKNNAGFTRETGGLGTKIALSRILTVIFNLGARSAQKPLPLSAKRIAVLCLLLLALPAAAQSGGTAPGDFPGVKGEFFLGASAESALYSNDRAAFGGGAVFGYGFDIGALGAALDYLTDPDGLATLAPRIFVRFYLPLAFINARYPYRSGPFLQFGIGPSFHARDSRFASRVPAAAVSAGLDAGWRFLFGDRWYIEPALRGGYPFIAGAGVSAGRRF
jgi:hypothetical protein